MTSTISAAHPFGGTDWAAGRVADLAIDEWDTLSGLYNLDKEAARNYLSKSVQKYTNRRADIGTVVHACMEHHFKGLPLPIHTREISLDRGRVLDEEGWQEAEQVWHQLKALLTRINLRPWKVEPLIVNRTLGYAGSADLIARSDEWNGLMVVDLKTKPKRDKPRPEVRQQLAAYGNGELVLEEDDTETELFPMRVRQDKGIALIASKVAAEVFVEDLAMDAFMHSMYLAKFYANPGAGSAQIQLQATETPEEVADDIVAAQSYAELQALYYRHVARGKWLPEHTEMAAVRRGQLEATSN